MYAGYYIKEVDYGDLKTTVLVRLDENTKAYIYSHQKKTWIESKDHQFVWEDLDYNKISKEEAEKLTE